jgi:hypothetical protein
MSVDTRDFNKFETRAVIKNFFSLQVKAPEEIHAILTQNIKGICTIICHHPKLSGPVKHGDFSTCVGPRPGRHKPVTTPGIINQIHDLINIWATGHLT